MPIVNYSAEPVAVLDPVTFVCHVDLWPFDIVARSRVIRLANVVPPLEGSEGWETAKTALRGLLFASPLIIEPVQDQPDDGVITAAAWVTLGGVTVNVGLWLAANWFLTKRQ